MKRNGKLITKTEHFIYTSLFSKLNFVSEKNLIVLDQTLHNFAILKTV